MTREKQLLLKDLCARLPYEVKGLHRGKIQRLLVMDSFGSYQVNGYAAWFNLNSVNFKPYLRPMSSMTEEEKGEFDKVLKSCNDKVFACPDKERRYNFFDAEQEDFTNAHHFDYRGLIPMGLALEAPEGMYKQ